MKLQPSQLIMLILSLCSAATSRGATESDLPSPVCYKTLTEVRLDLIKSASIESDIRALIERAKTETENRNINAKKALSREGVLHANVAFLIGAGPQAANLSGFIVDQKRAKQSALNDDVILASSTGIAPNFKDRSFLLNSPEGYNLHPIAPFYDFGYEVNPFPASPIGVLEILYGDLRGSIGRRRYFEDYQRQGVGPRYENGSAIELRRNDIPQSIRHGLIFPSASYVYDATLLTIHQSGAPVLTDMTVESLRFDKKSGQVESIFENGNKVTAPRVVITGIGREKIPFDDRDSLKVFSKLRAEGRAGTLSDYFNAVALPEPERNAFFSKFKNRRVLVVGEGDGGNNLAENLMNLDPRGSGYPLQVPAEVAATIDFTWSGQRAKTAAEFRQMQNFERGILSRGVFRDIRYQHLENLYKNAHFRVAPHVSSMALHENDEGFFVTFDGGSTEAFDYIFTAAGYEDKTSDLLKTLSPAGYSLKVIRAPITHKGSSNFGKTLRVAYQVTIGGEPLPVYVAGAAAYSLVVEDNSPENIGGHSDTYRRALGNPASLLNNAYRIEAFARWLLGD